MIVIIDSGVGNLRSVLHKVTKLGTKATIATSGKELAGAEKLIFPGVGSFDAAMKNLQNTGMIPALNELVLDEKVPILGICLGMQLLSKGSEEGEIKGLGWIDATVKRFSFTDSSLKVPHVGWNSIIVKKNSPILEGFGTGDDFYFTHSYHFQCKHEEDILTTTEYGYEFVSAVNRDNIYGTQFHPEKSHKKGMQLVKNFIELV